MTWPAIVTRDAPATGPCATCGEEVFTQAGPALVDLDSSAPVCDDCGMECSPELLALLKPGEVALICAAMMDFGPRRDFAPGPEKVC